MLGGWLGPALPRRVPVLTVTMRVETWAGCFQQARLVGCGHLHAKAHQADLRPRNLLLVLRPGQR